MRNLSKFPHGYGLRVVGLARAQADSRQFVFVILFFCCLRPPAHISFLLFLLFRPTRQPEMNFLDRLTSGWVQTPTKAEFGLSGHEFGVGCKFQPKNTDNFYAVCHRIQCVRPSSDMRIWFQAQERRCHFKGSLDPFKGPLGFCKRMPGSINGTPGSFQRTRGLFKSTPGS